jgi:NadR type nicotinamide-nucleotide adenylyltransferase
VASVEGIDEGRVSARLLRAVVTGSECTGKTTLAAHLAARCGAPWSPEFARAYQERTPRILTACDVEPIARGQLEAEDAAVRAASRIVIHDTDIVSTIVYSRHYYGSCPSWIEEAARGRRADLYLLLFPDVPWVADGLQRDRPTSRHEVHALFDKTLREYGACVVDVTGTWIERARTAERAIEALLADPA